MDDSLSIIIEDCCVICYEKLDSTKVYSHVTERGLESLRTCAEKRNDKAFADFLLKYKQNPGDLKSCRNCFKTYTDKR